MPRQPVKILLVPALLALLLTAGCALNPTNRKLRDLQRMPQDPTAYLDPATAGQPLISPERQRARAAGFLERLFAAWHTDNPLASTRSPFWAVDWIGKNTVFGENLRPVGPGRIRRLIRLADRQSYPSLDRRAITVRRCNLRALPTDRPLFKDPREAGEGFPFDELQQAALPADTPVHVTHRTADGSWVFVETSLAYGWMPVTGLAWVDEGFVRGFETGRFVALTRDRVPVLDAKGRFRFRAGIGTLLPVSGTAPGSYRVLLAVADKDRQAILTEGTIPKDRGELFPLPLTPRRIAGLAQTLVGERYGWGGSFGDRDCSATMHDLFAPFGLWLPRNSSRQALAGEVIPLSDLSPPARERRLIEKGIPFLTLVHLPGHIMLYIGEHGGRAAVLHALWGLGTRNLWGQEGRWIVGKTVITTLEPGREGAGLFVSVSNLRKRIESMNILLPSKGPNDREPESEVAIH